MAKQEEMREIRVRVPASRLEEAVATIEEDVLELGGTVTVVPSKDEMQKRVGKEWRTQREEALSSLTRFRLLTQDLTQTEALNEGLSELAVATFPKDEQRKSWDDIDQTRLSTTLATAFARLLPEEAPEGTIARLRADGRAVLYESGGSSTRLLHTPRDITMTLEYFGLVDGIPCSYEDVGLTHDLSPVQTTTRIRAMVGTLRRNADLRSIVLKPEYQPLSSYYADRVFEH